jgi:1-acyl-sn-glycerol-3-phosphate acyltransferase|tara:strand:+ start:14 stop:733 length:720 start_codon:yes stop_codon:yes gene_type:complete
MITAIKSILIYICSLFIFLPSGILFIVTSFILPTHLMYKSARIVSWLMLKSLFVKLEIDGDIPSPGGRIYMFNHSSFIDVFLFAYLTPGNITAVIAKENYNIPVWGAMLKRFRAIPIERKNKDSAIQTINMAEDRLSNGYDVIILPEGTRTLSGKLKRFKKGGFHMAINTKAPIVPVGCIGAFEFKPKDRWTLSPGTVKLICGKPIDPSTYSSLGLNGLVSKVEQEIQQLTNGKFEDEI